MRKRVKEGIEAYTRFVCRWRWAWKRGCETTRFRMANNLAESLTNRGSIEHGLVMDGLQLPNHALLVRSFVD